MMQLTTTDGRTLMVNEELIAYAEKKGSELEPQVDVCFGGSAIVSIKAGYESRDIWEVLEKKAETQILGGA